MEDIAAVESDLCPIGEVPSGEGRLRLYCASDELRLEHSLYGSCRLRRGGAELIWSPGPVESAEMARALILGPVLSLALQQRGALCLHGSAVTIGDSGIVFLAPKFHGKSTLALAMVLAGARLLSDDTLAVDVGPPVLVRPGVHSIRVCDDTRAAMDADRLPARLVHGVKSTIVDFPGARLAFVRVPLRAIYVLAPRRREDLDAPASRLRLSRLEASLALVSHAKLVDPLIGLDAAGRQLRQASVVAERLPVYTLLIARRLECLSAVAERLFAWHRSERWSSTSRDESLR